MHYLQDAADIGDELHVIVARAENVTHKEPPVVPDEQRREMVAALDRSTKLISATPKISVNLKDGSSYYGTLAGYDQHHDDVHLEAALTDRGIDCDTLSGHPPESRR